VTTIRELTDEVAALRAAIDDLRSLPCVQHDLEARRAARALDERLAIDAAAAQRRREELIERAATNPRVRITVGPRGSRVCVERGPGTVGDILRRTTRQRSFVVGPTDSPIFLASDWATMIATDTEIADRVARGDVVATPLTADENVVEQNRVETIGAWV